MTLDLHTDADAERRDELYEALRLSAVLHRILTSTSSHDPFEQARDYLEDIDSDVIAEINRLTDEIGDGRGDNYPGERSMLAFRQTGVRT